MRNNYPTDNRRGLGRALSALTAAALLAAVAVTLGCKSAAPPGKPKLRNVSVEVIESIPELEDTVKLTGETEPNRIVKVLSEVAGRIEKVAVTEGQLVHGNGEAPSLLVSLNTELLRAQLDLCKADEEFASLEAERLDELFEKDVATRHERDRGQTQLVMAKARTATAQANMDRSQIYAPIGGVLNSLPAEEGEYLQPGTLVAEIVDVDKIKVVVPIPERDVSFLSVNDRAKVIARQRGRDEEFFGPITYISKIPDPQTFTSRVEVTIDNSDGRLRTGQIVDVIFTRRIIPDAIMIPLEAVIPRQNSREVYTVSPQAELWLAIPKDVSQSLTVGSPVSVSTVSQEGQSEKLSGEVASIVPNENTGLETITMTVSAESVPLLPGQFVTIEFAGGSIIEAMIEQAGERMGEPAKDAPPRTVAGLSRFADRRVVQLGIIRGSSVQVVSGLSAGDMLIVSGQQYVASGQAVRIVPSVEELTAKLDETVDRSHTDRLQQ